ncbi:MmcQ/YjbR family DNA-binding protein [Pseudonocardia sp. GCM10023141]|uniref:MmcQ/YjbR family DNA-binding protein n=1 Tax=Pseudonocardia sp. GCM10023141 TaxID=3252653 RepID=UPI0036085E1F
MGGAGRRTLVQYWDACDEVGILGMWCPAPPGVQESLVDAEPGRFFRPPHVGGSGWLGVRLDVDPDWTEVTAIVEEAFRIVAPKRSVADWERD